MRKPLLLPVLAAGLLSVAPLRAQTPPTSIDMGGTWKVFKGDNKGWAKADFDDTLWKDATVPGTVQASFDPSFKGFAWYRKHVILPKSWGNDPLVKQGKVLRLDLGTIRDAYEVYWDGQIIAEGGKLPPSFQAATGEVHAGVPADVTTFGGDNVLAVRVYSNGAQGGIISGAPVLREPVYGDFLRLSIDTKDNASEFNGAAGLPFDVVVENTAPAAWEGGTVKLTVSGGGQPSAASSIPVTVSSNRAFRAGIALKEADLNPGIYTITAVAQQGGSTVQTASRTLLFNPGGIRNETFHTTGDASAFKTKQAQFWKTTIAAVKNTPIGGTSTLDEAQSNDQVKVYHVSYNALKGETIYGWLAVPNKAGTFPGVVLLPGYGNESVDPPVFLAQNGIAALAINVHGSDVNAKTYPSEVDTYMKGGFADPNTFVMRSMVAAGLRGLDYLSQRPEVDANRLGAAGASQGGGLALDVAALDPRVKVVVANSPAGDWPRMFSEAKNNPASMMVNAMSASQRATLATTMAYFDPALLADDIHVPVLITIGMKDTVTPPETAYALKNAIPKGVAVMIQANADSGHGATPDQGSASLDWLRKFLVG